MVDYCKSQDIFLKKYKYWICHHKTRWVPYKLIKFFIYNEFYKVFILCFYIFTTPTKIFLLFDLLTNQKKILVTKNGFKQTKTKLINFMKIVLLINFVLL